MIPSSPLWLRLLQSGNLNFYLALIGLVLVLILGISLLE
jgi:hypothetical protein